LAAVVVMAADHTWTEGVLHAARADTTAALVVVGRLRAAQVINAVEMGADVVISDEMPDEEILARVLAAVRSASPALDTGARFLVSGPLTVDLWARSVAMNEEPLRLSPTEYRLLTVLMGNAGRAMLAVRLLELVWGWSDTGGLNALRISITRLRHKLGDQLSDPRFVRSVRGHGYIFFAPVSQHCDDGIEVGGPARRFDSLTRIANATGQLVGAEARAGFVVRSLVGEGVIDAAAIMRVRGARLHVLAHHGFTPTWRRAVCPSFPLAPGYASVQAIERNEFAHCDRFSSADQRYARTAALLDAEDSQTGVFIPIVVNGRCWGSLGGLRRSERRFSLTTLAYLRSVLAIYGSSLARPEPLSR
jgi:DNA-binding response OmpR family regulator